MRTVLVVALAASLAWSAGEYVAVNPEAPSVPQIPKPDKMCGDIELSHDNGDIQNAWVYLTGANTYVGDQYDTPIEWPYLYGIKYYVYPGWPDSAYQGFSVACWKMESGEPGAVVWPTDGNPIYNPNTGGCWITQAVDPQFNLLTGAPDGFLVGIGFFYSYPAMDAFGVDDTGPGPYDWSYVGGTWGAAPYGVGSARALLPGGYYPQVEPATLGTLRALYR